MIQSTFRCISLIAPRNSNVVRRSFGVLPQFAGLGPLPASRMHSTKPARVPRNTMELFNMLDLDRNGVLDKTEFYSATAKLNMSEEDTEKLFTKLDINGDGVLTAKEFSDIELQGSLFSVAGLAHFFKQNVMDRATQLEMANPGRWTLSTDKFEKESRKVKQYYD